MSVEFQSLEQVSEYIRDHLLKQKARAVPVGRATGCMYRTQEGLRCAVGCLIDDSVYDERIEGSGIGSGVTEFVIKSHPSLDKLHHQLLLSLLHEWQLYHDQGVYEKWTSGAACSLGPSEFHVQLRGRYGKVDS